MVYLNTSGAVLDREQLGCHTNHQMTICRLKKIKNIIYKLYMVFVQLATKWIQNSPQHLRLKAAILLPTDIAMLSIGAG